MVKHYVALVMCMAFWGGFITGESAFAKTFKDSDWNTSMRVGCTTSGSMKQMSENGNKFVRVTHGNKIGGCASDRKNNMQRSEMKTQKTMKPGSTWEYSANVRFMTELQGEAYFMQIHAKPGKGQYCHKQNGIKTTPPVKLMLRNNTADMVIFGGGQPHNRVGPGWGDTWKLFEIGKWTQVKIVMDLDVQQTNVDVYVGGKKVIDGYKINSQNSCIKPWGKMGIYRSAQFTSPVVVDYDKVVIRKLQ